MAVDTFKSKRGIAWKKGNTMTTTSNFGSFLLVLLVLFGLSEPASAQFWNQPRKVYLEGQLDLPPVPPALEGLLGDVIIELKLPKIHEDHYLNPSINVYIWTPPNLFWPKWHWLTLSFEDVWSEIDDDGNWCYYTDPNHVGSSIDGCFVPSDEDGDFDDAGDGDFEFEHAGVPGSGTTHESGGGWPNA